MIQDCIKYNGKEYQLSTARLSNMIETMIFPIENGVVSGNEVYCFRTVNANESINKHKDVYYHPEKYLSDDAVTEYMKSKEDFATEELIPFPFQFLEKCFLGEISLDDAVNSTIDEVNRLIKEYVEKHNLKT